MVPEDGTPNRNEATSLPLVELLAKGFSDVNAWLKL
jgi:hypothetical protein